MKIEDMRVVVEQRTPGNWRVHKASYDRYQILDQGGGKLLELTSYGKMRSDAECIVMAINKADKLLAAAECLQHVLDMGHLTPGGSTEAWAKAVLKEVAQD